MTHWRLLISDETIGYLVVLIDKISRFIPNPVRAAWNSETIKENYNGYTGSRSDSMPHSGLQLSIFSVQNNMCKTLFSPY